jgi:hypothetical protein
MSTYIPISITPPQPATAKVEPEKAPVFAGNRRQRRAAARLAAKGLL